MPTFDELDALIAEARDPGTRCAWCDARATGWAFTDMSAGYGRDPQASCGPSHGFQWELDGRLASPDLIERLTAALSALRDTNPDEWELGRECCSNCRVVESWAGTVAFATHRSRKAGPWLPVPSSPEGSKK